MNIYLDIDGVLLHKGSASIGAKDFLNYVCKKYPNEIYWLTTRCKGDAVNTVNQIKEYFSEGTVELLSSIKPTSWATLKAEAIDLSKPFLWFDDNLIFAEKKLFN